MKFRPIQLLWLPIAGVALSLIALAQILEWIGSVFHKGADLCDSAECALADRMMSLDP